jgi:hypothetical protein
MCEQGFKESNYRPCGREESYSGILLPSLKGLSKRLPAHKLTRRRIMGKEESSPQLQTQVEFGEKMGAK